MQSTSQESELTTMQDLYLEQLRDLSSAENQMIEALPTMVETAQNQPLKQGLQMHLEQTREHAQQLQQIFQRIGQDAEGETCEAMKGLIKEGQKMLQEGQPGPVLDAALIAAAQPEEDRRDFPAST